MSNLPSGNGVDGAPAADANDAVGQVPQHPGEADSGNFDNTSPPNVPDGADPEHPGEAGSSNVQNASSAVFSTVNQGPVTEDPDEAGHSDVGNAFAFPPSLPLPHSHPPPPSHPLPPSLAFEAALDDAIHAELQATGGAAVSPTFPPSLRLAVRPAVLDEQTAQPDPLATYHFHNAVLDLGPAQDFPELPVEADTSTVQNLPDNPNEQADLGNFVDDLLPTTSHEQTDFDDLIADLHDSANPQFTEGDPADPVEPLQFSLAGPVQAIENLFGAEAPAPNPQPVNQNEHNEAVNQNQHNEAVNQDQHNEAVNQDQHNEPANQNEHNEPVNQNQHNEPVDQNQHNEPVNQHPYNGNPTPNYHIALAIAQRRQEEEEAQWQAEQEAQDEEAAYWRAQWLAEQEAEQDAQYEYGARWQAAYTARQARRDARREAQPVGSPADPIVVPGEAEESGLDEAEGRPRRQETRSVRQTARQTARQTRRQTARQTARALDLRGADHEEEFDPDNFDPDNFDPDEYREEYGPRHKFRRSNVYRVRAKEHRKRLAQIARTMELYQKCPCGLPDDVEEMVCCDGDHVVEKWEHLECAGLTSAPEGDWFCQACRCVRKAGRYLTERSHTESSNGDRERRRPVARGPNGTTNAEEVPTSTGQGAVVPASGRTRAASRRARAANDADEVEAQDSVVRSDAPKQSSKNSRKQRSGRSRTIPKDEESDKVDPEVPSKGAKQSAKDSRTKAPKPSSTDTRKKDSGRTGPAPEEDESDSEDSDASTESPKKSKARRAKASSWSEEEDALTIVFMKEAKEALEMNPKGTIESLWGTVSDRLKAEGFNRTKGAVKNHWNRDLRADSGFDERLNPKPDMMRTSLLPGSGGPSKAQQRARTASKVPTSSEEDPPSPGEGPSTSRKRSRMVTEDPAETDDPVSEGGRRKRNAVTLVDSDDGQDLDSEDGKSKAKKATTKRRKRKSYTVVESDDELDRDDGKVMNSDDGESKDKEAGSKRRRTDKAIQKKVPEGRRAGLRSASVVSVDPAVPKTKGGKRKALSSIEEKSDGGSDESKAVTKRRRTDKAVPKTIEEGRRARSRSGSVVSVDPAVPKMKEMKRKAPHADDEESDSERSDTGKAVTKRRRTDKAVPKTMKEGRRSESRNASVASVGQAVPTVDKGKGRALNPVREEVGGDEDFGPSHGFEEEQVENDAAMARQLDRDLNGDKPIRATRATRRG